MRLFKVHVQFSRFIRLCALAGVLLYPFLAALHSATDEAHLFGAHHPKLVMSASVVTSGTLPQSDHEHSHAPGDRRDHQLCNFCILAGVTLLTATEHVPAPYVIGPSTSGCSGRQCVGISDRLNIGHPVRAPPRIV